MLDRVWKSFFPAIFFFFWIISHTFGDLVFGLILDIKSLRDFRWDSLRILRILCLYFFRIHSFVFSGSFFFFLKLAGRVRIAFWQSSSNHGLLIFEMQELFVMFSLAIERRISAKCVISSSLLYVFSGISLTLEAFWNSVQLAFRRFRGGVI